MKKLNLAGGAIFIFALLVMVTCPGALFSQTYPDNIEATPIADHVDSLRILAAKTDGDFYHHHNIKIPTAQVLSFTNDTLYLTDGGYVYLGGYTPVEASDDQQITDFSFDPGSQQFSFSLENGGAVSVSLASLEERLILSGNSLNIIGSSGAAIDLSPYLDNSDDQQLTDLSYSNGVLTVELEDGGALSVNTQDAEVDPIFSSSPSASITNADIANWNNDEVDDTDADPGNELDPIEFLQTASNNVLANGGNDNVNQGKNVVIEYYIDSTITAVGFAAGAGTDDQKLTLIDGVLSLEDGGSPIDLTEVVASSESGCVEVDVSTQSYVSPIDLPGDPDKRSIYINGDLCTERLTLSRVLHVSINSTTNNVTFYEALENDRVSFCRN